MTNYDNLEPVNRVPEPPMKRWKVRIKLADVVKEVEAADHIDAEVDADFSFDDVEIESVDAEELP